VTPRLGFLGVGWIGRSRLEALARRGLAEIAVIADPSPARREAARAIAPRALVCEHLGQLLEEPLDGVVIATPSALHAEQAIAALGRGLAVFCQKPLARTEDEARQVVLAARAADRLLGVDLSYRHTEAVQRIAALVRAGAIGRVFAANLVFHNAYGLDAPWFHDKAAAGGGCVMDLGIHLVDLVLWLLDFPAVRAVDSRLFARGEPIALDEARVEDYAAVQLELDGGVVVQLACSWRLPAGRDAVIEAALYGTEGAVAMRNLDGSFYDFVAERMRGTGREHLSGPPDDWGGRALIDWTTRLAGGAGYDAEAERFVEVAGVLDAVYGRRRRPPGA
jgi:predicted dehydrogenase